jgi:hypothetical protein
MHCSSLDKARIGSMHRKIRPATLSIAIASGFLKNRREHLRYVRNDHHNNDHNTLHSTQAQPLSRALRMNSSSHCSQNSRTFPSSRNFSTPAQSIHMVFPPLHFSAVCLIATSKNRPGLFIGLHCKQAEYACHPIRQRSRNTGRKE